MQLDKKVITLKSTEDKTISYNYHYSIMQNIYRSMNVIDKSKSMKIHNVGFEVENKTFKLFNYHVYFENANYIKEGIEVKKDGLVKLSISGATPVLNLIFKGILKNGYIEIDGLKFNMISAQDDKKFRFNKIMLYKVRSPIVESTFNPETKKAEFLNPYDNRYYEALGKNLLRKYEATYGCKYEGELFFEIEDFCKVKQKFIKDINKDGFVLGFTNFEIYIEADVDMQKIAYNLGLGQNNSIGMGNISYITGRGM